MNIKLFDTVELLRDSTEVPELRAGAIGTVVDVSGNALMVEFFDPEGEPGYNTIDVLSLWSWDVRLVGWC